MYKAVIFDLWQTLGTKNVAVSSELQAHFGIPNDDAYLKNYEGAVQLRAWDTERDMAKSFLTKFGLDQNEQNIDFVIDVFRRGIQNASVYDGAVNLLRNLKEQGTLIGVLSNTTVFESVILDNFGIKDLFDTVVFSWQNGYLKPSEESFNDILATLGVKPNEAVFVDDGQKNVDAAKRLGMFGIIFSNVADLQNELKNIGLL